MERSASALYFFEDVEGLGRPDKGFGIGVMPIDVIADSRNQLFDIAENSPPEPIVREIAEEAFDHIEPRTAGGCEMHVEALAASQPLLYFWVLVSSVIIRDQINVLSFGCDLVDDSQKLQPFLMPMPVVAHADYGAVERVHRSK